MGSKAKRRAKNNFKKKGKLRYSTSSGVKATGNLKNGLIILLLPQFSQMKQCVVSGVRDALSGIPLAVVHPIVGMGCSYPSANGNHQFEWPTNSTTQHYTIGMVLANPLSGAEDQVVSSDANPVNRVFRMFSHPRFWAFNTAGTPEIVTLSTPLSARQIADGYTVTGRIGSDKVPILSVQAITNQGGTGGANDFYTSTSGAALSGTLQTLNITNFDVFCNSFGAEAYGGQVFMVVIWNRKLSDDEDRAWHNDPFSLIENETPTPATVTRRNSSSSIRAFANVIS